MNPPLQIQMVDLKAQYLNIKDEIDVAMTEVLDNTSFINGRHVEQFAAHLSEYLNVPHVIPCANGTDALQIALMALNLQPGDEVIVPAFTYVATAEVIALLRLVPVMVDVHKDNFNINTDLLDTALTPKTRAIVPVHLFGQCANMTPLTHWAQKHKLFIIEDAAQSLGAIYRGELHTPPSRTGVLHTPTSQRSTSPTSERCTFPPAHAGTIGHIGCTSFFPSKNLGCFGDGGALMTRDTQLAERIKMIANHGQQKKYTHQIVGCNSRLDTLQAAILDVKLKYLDQYAAARYAAAQRYTQALQGIDGLICPKEEPYSTHVYHQYTLRISNGQRDALKNHLAAAGISTAIYYPLPLHQQEAFAPIARTAGKLTTSEQLCTEVLSLPMHTELTPQIQNTITSQIQDFFTHN